MNTVLSTRVDEHPTHPPSSVHSVSDRRTVSLPDRVALHLGLALITWSRRPRTVIARPSSVDAGARYRSEADRAERERLWQLALYLGQPRR
ncbi:MAG TPA: hypothetical protein VGF80_10170 [Galbitalea sp.]